MTKSCFLNIQTIIKIDYIGSVLLMNKDSLKSKTRRDITKIIGGTK